MQGSGICIQSLVRYVSHVSTNAHMTKDMPRLSYVLRFHTRVTLLPPKIHHSRAIAWVDEPLLAQAHKRLPPADLYYPVDEEASRQGRWQEQAEEALEECGYAYFLPPTTAGSVDGDGVHGAVVAAFSGNNNGSGELSSAENTEPKEDTSLSSTTTTTTPGEKRPRPGQLRPTTSRNESRRSDMRSRRRAIAAAAAERGIAEQQSHGLHLELKRALRVASTTFREGDRVESRWRRPTRLDKPRLDPDAWHPGRVVQSSKNSGRVDVVFEDGDGERLSGIPSKYVRLAPSPSSLEGLALASPEVIEEGTPAAVATAAAGRENFDGSAHTRTLTMPIDSLCPASRRELAHLACANNSLRRTWEDPVPMSQELARLKMLGEEKMRSRPEWRGSFPVVDFQATKRLSIGAHRMGAGARRTAAAAMARNRRRERRQAHEIPGRTVRSRTRESAAAALLTKQRAVEVREDREDKNLMQGKQDCTSALVEIDAAATTRNSSTTATVHGGTAPSLLVLSLSQAALVESQAKLVAAAVAYDRCVAGVRECLDRGAAAFRTASTYSDQQKAFEESTAALGPAQPARAGYTDWRGRAVVGLQNSTLDVVEAMDSWAAEWEAAREGDTEAGQAGGVGWKSGARNDGGFDGEEEVGKDGAVPAATVKAPPFLWEGSPLVSTIVDHSASIVAGAPELKEWYGPGFPIERNPFFLAYSVDDRPVTPRSALVRALVNGEVRGGWVDVECYSNA